MERRQRPPFVRYGNDGDTVSDEEVLNTRADAIDRAERTLDIQRERFDRIDEKASKILRFVAVLSGAVFAVFGFGPPVFQSGGAGLAARTSVGTEVALTVAGISFVATTFLAAVTYVTTRFGSSFSAQATEQVKENRFETEVYQQLLLESYGEAIKRNRPRLDENNRTFIYTLCSLMVAISFLTAAAVMLAVDPAANLRRLVLGVTCVLSVAFVIFVLG